MSEFKTLDQCADCIEATNLGTVNAYKGAFAVMLRNNNIDLLALDAIERDARRQVAACRFIRNWMAERMRG